MALVLVADFIQNFWVNRHFRSLLFLALNPQFTVIGSTELQLNRNTKK